MKKPDLIVLLGPPRCGLRALEESLHALDFNPISNATENGTATIHALLEIQLGLDPGCLLLPPHDWEYLPKLRNSHQRISQLLNASTSDQPFVLSDPDLGRFLPIWLQCIEDLELSTLFLHLVRNPLEVAQSIRAVYNLPLRRALETWEAIHLNVIKHCPDATRISFDDFLDDPLENLASFITWDIPALKARKEVLRKVSPHFRRFVAEDFDSKDLNPDRYLRFHEYLGSEPGATSLPLPPGNLIKRFESSSEAQLSPNSYSFNPLTTTHELSASITCIQETLPRFSNLGDNEDAFPDKLSLSIDIATKQEDVKFSRNETLTPFSWTSIDVSLPESGSLLNRYLQIIPYCTGGILEFREISLSNRATDKLIWEANFGDTRPSLNIIGSCLKLPSKSTLVLVGTDNNLKIRLLVPDKIPDVPLNLHIEAKYTQNVAPILQNDYFIFQKSDLFRSDKLKDEGLLDSQVVNRLLHPIWPEETGNSSPPTLRYLLKNQERMSATKKFASSASYKLPTFLISFPRAGSNFLQTVVQQSSGLFCCSIYSPRPVDSGHVLSYKSHAISPTALVDEIARYLPDVEKPSKTILLKRDPRDMLISFYEYVQTQKDISIAQDDFLEEVSYFYAFNNNSSTVQSSKRRNEFQPFNIAGALRRFTEQWFEIKPDLTQKLVLSYEDLVLSPESSFKSIFDFLEIDAQLDKKALKIKVSQYSENHRPRGQPYGWKEQSQYSKLIDITNELMGDLVEKLGYEI